MPEASPRRFASTLSIATDSDAALDEVCQRIEQSLQGTPDLVLAFLSTDHAHASERIAETLCRRLGTEQLIGCTGESIVGTGCEVEQQPALSVWAAQLPGSRVLPMHLTFETTSEGPTLLGWPDFLLEDWPEQATLLTLGEPFSFPAEFLLEQINEQHAGTSIVGGMSSGGAAPGANRLMLGPRVVTDGAVAVLLDEKTAVRSIVSQGCRPIGHPYVVTKAEQNLMLELGGRSAFEQLQELFTSLPTSDQRLVNEGLHVGRVVNEYQESFEHGDFLIRNVLGADPENGAIAIGDYVRVGQTVQFHVRDEQTADSDLRQLLSQSTAPAGMQPGGALLFTCNGRGTRLFSEAHHDALCIQQVAGSLPVAGFFAQGELGPVGGKSFIHGFTASIVMFDT